MKRFRDINAAVSTDKVTCAYSQIESNGPRPGSFLRQTSITNADWTCQLNMVGGGDKEYDD